MQINKKETILVILFDKASTCDININEVAEKQYYFTNILISLLICFDRLLVF